MEIIDRCNKVVSLQSEVFKLIRNNDKKRYTTEQQLNNLKNNFLMTQNSYPEEVKKHERYNLQYIFLFEQYNFKRITLENELQMIDAYDKRLKKLSEHLFTRKSNRLLDVKRTLYEFNSLVQNELVRKYKLKIEELKQKKIMSDRYEDLLNYLEQNNINEYNEKKEFAYSDEEKMETENSIEKLTDNQLSIINILKNDHFDINDDVVMSLALANENILLVATKMYPGLKELISSKKTTEKRKAA